MRPVVVLLLAALAPAVSSCGSEGASSRSVGSVSLADCWRLHLEHPSRKALAVALDDEGGIACWGSSWGFDTTQRAIDAAFEACRDTEDFPGLGREPVLFVLENEVVGDLTQAARGQVEERIASRRRGRSGREAFGSDEEWERYLARPPVKAVAVGIAEDGSVAGWGAAWGYATAAEAIEVAVEQCRGASDFPEDGSEPHLFLLNERVMIDLSPADRDALLGRYRSLRAGPPREARNSLAADTWAEYRALPPHRALVVGRDENGNVVCSGWSWGFATMEEARAHADRACREGEHFRKAASGPHLFAVNDEVVADLTEAALAEILGRFRSLAK